jgi:hypothetical protein
MVIPDFFRLYFAMLSILNILKPTRFLGDWISNGKYVHIYVSKYDISWYIIPSTTEGLNFLFLDLWHFAYVFRYPEIVRSSQDPWDMACRWLAVGPKGPSGWQRFWVGNPPVSNGQALELGKWREWCEPYPAGCFFSRMRWLRAAFWDVENHLIAG